MANKATQVSNYKASVASSTGFAFPGRGIAATLPIFRRPAAVLFALYLGGTCLLPASKYLPLQVPTVEAQSIAAENEIRFQYSYYRDWQDGGEERMTVRAPQAWFLSPVTDSTEVEGSFVLDTVSGASPLYHDTLSGASEAGIEDERLAGDIKVTEYLDGYSIGVGVSYSHEDDYDSGGGSLELRSWNEDKSRVYSFGIGGHHDQITSTNDPELDESNNSGNLLFGITQIIDRISLLQANITIASTDGYQTDPYKSADERPQSRDEAALLLRYVRYIEQFESSLHADYRYFFDSWGVLSHTLELQWYQPVSEHWTLRPSWRYYTQSKADFYSSFFPPPESGEGFYSADHRLSGFGAMTIGLKAIRDFGDGFTTHLGIDFYQQRGRMKLFGEGSPGLDPFYELFFSCGFSKRF
jgi:hypothetical protein